MKPTRVRLRKIEASHSNLRTDVIDGEALSLPTIGKRFVMFSEPIDKTKDYRELITSPVVAVDGTIFKTQNSTYELTVCA